MQGDSSKGKKIIARGKKVIITTGREPYDLVIDHGDGDYIYDVDGKKYIDFTSMISVYNFGVNSIKPVREAIKKQIDGMMHSAFGDFYSDLPVRFAENLLTMFPKGFGKVFYSNSGTEANEAAIKFAKMFTKRQYIFAFYNSFHGRTYGSLSMTSSKIRQREYYGPFTATIHAPYAYCYRCPFGQEYPSCGMACVDYIKKYPLAKDVSPHEVAAIVTEPIQGEGGYIVPPKEFMQEIRKIATDNGIVLISDEVQAGYMRAGKFLGLSNFGVEADIYSMAKTIGAGLPFGVTVTRSSLGDIPAGAHGNTFGGNLAVVAGAEAQLIHVKKNLAHIEDEIKTKGKLILKRLNEMKDKYEIIGDVRGIGMMNAIELVKDRKTKDPATNEANHILIDSYNNGLLLLSAGQSSIRLIPPITISLPNLNKGLDILEAAVEKENKKLK